MKLLALAITCLLTSSSAIGQGWPQVDLQMSASSVVLDREKLAGDGALKTALIRLAKKNPKLAIRIHITPGIPFGRTVHLMEIVRASGLKTYLIGSEDPNIDHTVPD